MRIPCLVVSILLLQCNNIPERTFAPPADGVYLAVSELDGLYASYSGILKDYVRQGDVDYEHLCKDPDFGRVMNGFRAVDSSTIQTRAQGLAFWINAYNAFTLDVICQGYPVESINDLHGAGGHYSSVLLGRTIWQAYKFPIGSQEFTLDQIEHKILRKKYSDFRIHAGIVCASKSCPLLRSEAFVPQRIDAQLDDQMQQFLASEYRNRLEPSSKTIYLSKIFDWFKEDFTGQDRSLLRALWKFMPADWHASLVNVENAEKQWKVRYLTYDWSLNGR